MTDAKQLELEHAAWLARPARENQELGATWYELVWALNYEAGGQKAAFNTAYELIEPHRARIEAMVQDTLDHAGIGSSDYYFLAYPGANYTTIAFGDAVNELVFTEDACLSISICGDINSDFWQELRSRIEGTIYWCIGDMFDWDYDEAPNEFRLDPFTRSALERARSMLSY